MTMTLIATATVGAGGAGDITFYNIPQDGTDLLLLASARSLSAQTAPRDVTVFTDGTTSTLTLRSQGTSVTSSTTLRAISLPGASSPSGIFGNFSLYVPMYTSSGNKAISIDSVVPANDTSNNRLGFDATVVTMSGPVTYLGFSASGVAEHSTASLYKITKGSDGIVTTS